MEDPIVMTDFADSFFENDDIKVGINQGDEPMNSKRDHRKTSPTLRTPDRLSGPADFGVQVSGTWIDKAEVPRNYRTRNSLSPAGNNYPAVKKEFSIRKNRPNSSYVTKTIRVGREMNQDNPLTVSGKKCRTPNSLDLNTTTFLTSATTRAPDVSYFRSNLANRLRNFAINSKKAVFVVPGKPNQETPSAYSHHLSSATIVPEPNMDSNHVTKDSEAIRIEPWEVINPSDNFELLSKAIDKSAKKSRPQSGSVDSKMVSRFAPILSQSQPVPTLLVPEPKQPVIENVNMLRKNSSHVLTPKYSSRKINKTRPSSVEHIQIPQVEQETDKDHVNIVGRRITRYRNKVEKFRNSIK